jgi:hypothetical protein
MCIVGSRCVNVNTTDATAGATTLLLPAQNTHTLQDPKRDTEHARAGGVEDGLGVGGLDGGGDGELEMLATWCVRKLRGDALTRQTRQPVLRHCVNTDNPAVDLTYPLTDPTRVQYVHVPCARVCDEYMYRYRHRHDL